MKRYTDKQHWLTFAEFSFAFLAIIMTKTATLFVCTQASAFSFPSPSSSRRCCVNAFSILQKIKNVNDDDANADAGLPRKDNFCFYYDTNKRKRNGLKNCYSNTLFMSPKSTPNEEQEDDERRRRKDETKKKLLQRKQQQQQLIPNDENEYNPIFPFLSRSDLGMENVQLLFFDVILILNLSLSIGFWVIYRFQLDHVGIALGEGSLLALLWIMAGIYHGSFLFSATTSQSSSSSFEKKFTWLDEENTQRRTTKKTASKGDVQGDDNTDDVQQEIGNEEEKEEEEEEEVTNRSNDGMQQQRILNFLNTQPQQRMGGGPGAAGMVALQTMLTVANLRLIIALIAAVLTHRYVGNVYEGEAIMPIELGAGFVLMSMWRALYSQYVSRW